MTKKRMLIAIAILIIATFGILLWKSSANTQTNQQPTPKKQSTQTKPKEKPKPPFIDLQPTIDAWANAQSADFGITVYDVAHNKTAGEFQPDKQFLMASVVKLYIAYLTLQDFQTGDQDPDSPAIQGYTKKECVYRMVHSSDNPCGDTMYDIMTPRAATSRLQAYGLSNTQITSYKTTAQDITTFLLRLHQKQDLNQENTDFLLDAMRTQTYRQGLPKGMPDAEVANKVAFYGNHLWHDVGIVTLPNKRVYMVSIFGYQGSNSALIADFGETIYTKLQENTQ